MKLIIDIPEKDYKRITKYQNVSGCGNMLTNAIVNGIPLDNNSERAEVQAYFDGEAYGWEQERKALIEDIKAEILRGHIEADLMYVGRIIEILDNIGKAERGE